MKKRSKSCLLSIVLVLALLVPLLTPPPARADDLTTQEKADALHELGLFSGQSNNGVIDYALEKQATRLEAAAMLIRLLGKDGKAKAQYQSGALECPFTDVRSWAKSTVSWLYEAGYVNGTNIAGLYKGDDYVDAQQFSALILRSLGYSEADGDFTWKTALDFAVQVGLIPTDKLEDWRSDFRRGQMVEMCYNALYLNVKDSSLTLLEKLTSDGIFKSSYDTTVSAVPALTLTPLYVGGGHFNRWSIEDPALADPVVCDVDGDGRAELFFLVRTLYCLDAATGSIKWSAPTGHDVTEPDGAFFGAPRLVSRAVRVLDVDADGKVEIVTFANNFGTDQTFVGIYDATGHFKYNWTTPHVVRAAEIADLDADGKPELVFGYGLGASGDSSVTVYSPDGTLRSGWPQRCGYGLFSDSMEVADLDGDGKPEIVCLYDEDPVAAFHADGSPVTATGGVYAGLDWNGLPVAESYGHELELVAWAKRHGGAASGQGLTGDTRESRNVNTGTYGGVVADDLDGDGKQELVFTSMILDGGLVMRNGGDTYKGVARYFTTFILNTDRTRYKNEAKGFDWTQMPTDVGAALTALESSTLSAPNIQPVTADVDADGNKEILFSDFDGKVHCFSLDGTEHGAWPFALNSRSTQVSSIASKPTVADVNGDGKPEVIFATYTENNQTTVAGKLYVLDGSGTVLASVTLSPRWGLEGKPEEHYANGSQATPLVADVDGDGKAEILVTTQSCGVCVYKVS